MTGDHSQAIQLPAEAYKPISEVVAPAGINNLPGRPGQFVGRDDELKILDAAMAATGRVVVQAVHGLGGIGKSTLVAQWAATRPHGHAPIRWITAASSHDVEQGLADFAAALQPALASVLPVEQLAERGMQWLVTHSDWLLILDNVNNIADVAHLLGRVTTGRVIVTSRRSSGWQPGITTIRLGVLKPEESTRLLNGILCAAGITDTDGGAELCTELGHLPLAIEQAGAYMAQNPLVTPRIYSQLLAKYPSVMYRETSVDTDAERPPPSIARVWRVTLDRIQTIQPAAADLLRALAWYNSDHIPSALCSKLADEPAINSALGVLNAYSMTTIDPATSTVSMHRLVQSVARTSDSEDPHRNHVAVEHGHASAVRALLSSLPDWESAGSWAIWQVLHPHIDSLLEHTISDSKSSVDLLLATGQYLHNHNMHTRAISYLSRVLMYHERVHGTDHPDTWDARFNFFRSLAAGGRTDDAIPMGEDFLANCERVIGEQHFHTINARHSLAIAYHRAQRFEDAIQLYERNLRIMDEVLGPDHRLTLVSRNNLASSYESAGQLEKAIPLYEQALADRERLFGPTHAMTFNTRSNVALAHQNAGRLDYAVRLQEQICIDSAQIFGQDHPQTLVSRNNLATAYQLAERLNEAISLYAQNLPDFERVFGHDDEQTLGCRENLATAYQSAGRLHEAIALFEKVLSDSERILGPGRQTATRYSLALTLMADRQMEKAIQLFQRLLVDLEEVPTQDPGLAIRLRVHIAQAYHFLGQLDDAIPAYEEVLNEQESSNIPVSIMPSIRSNLASAYTSVGQHDEALPLLVKILTDNERIHGPDHAEAIESRRNLASAYETVGQHDEALPLLVKILTDNERIHGPDHAETIESRRNLASAYETVGQHDEALPLLVKILTDNERIHGPDHNVTLACRNNLAYALQRSGRIHDAVRLHEQSLADHERVLGPEDPDTLNTRHSLASAYESVDRLTEAIDLFERNLEDRERVLGTRHNRTLASRNNLAFAYHKEGRFADAIRFFEQNLTYSEEELGHHHTRTLAARGNLAGAYVSAGRLTEAFSLFEINFIICIATLGPEHPLTISSAVNLEILEGRLPPKD